MARTRANRRLIEPSAIRALHSYGDQNQQPHHHDAAAQHHAHPRFMVQIPVGQAVQGWPGGGSVSEMFTSKLSLSISVVFPPFFEPDEPWQQ